MDEVVNDMYNKCLLEMQCCTMFDYIRLLDTHIQRMQGSDGAKSNKDEFWYGYYGSQSRFFQFVEAVGTEKG